MNKDIRFLDGLRGLAALSVLVSHARQFLWEGYWSGYLRHPQNYSFYNKVLMYLFFFFHSGRDAVLFFFVLSGFVIHFRYSDLMKTEKSKPKFRFTEFVWRRLRRLYPPLVVSLILTFGLDYLGRSFRFENYLEVGSSGVDSHFVQSALGFNVFWGNLLFLMNGLVPVYGSNHSLWSLGCEWWFYMLYPMFGLLAKRSFSMTTFTIFSIAAVIFLLHHPTNLLMAQVFAYFGIWWMGVGLADLYLRGVDKKWLLLSIFSLLLIPSFFFEGGETYVSPLDYVGGLGCFGAIAVCFFLRSRGLKLSFLEKLGWLGDMSYTLYVIHMPILVFASGLLMKKSAANKLPEHFGFVFLCCAIVFLLAYLLHFLIENPFKRSSPPTSSASVL